MKNVLILIIAAIIIYGIAYLTALLCGATTHLILVNDTLRLVIFMLGYVVWIVFGFVLNTTYDYSGRKDR